MDHKAIREAVEAYQHMVNNGHTSGFAFDVAFTDLDPVGCIGSLLADLDAKTEALKSVQAAIYMDDAGQLRLTRSFDEAVIDAALKGTP